jgi:flavin reductase (DIM6/NTAB) family NADH-FMN oxidoreductase RutF
MNIDKNKLEAMEQRFRAAFINSLGGFKSLVLIGTQSADGQTNLAVFSSLFHLGANPPLFGIIVRPDQADRHTFENIKSTGYFTVNHVSESFFEKAHQTSARYAREVSEFEAVGLTPEYWENFSVPLVKESAIKWVAQCKEIQNLSINGTHLVIGEMIEISYPEECQTTDGWLDIEKAGTLTVSGLDSYHVTKSLGRYSYAKPNLPLKKL